MGNLFAKFKPKRDISILLLGLDGAGKTTLLQNFSKEDTDEDQIPTVGYGSRRITIGRYNILLMDVGGGPNIRQIWPKYYAETHGIVFVVDATAIDRITEAKMELQSVLSDSRMSCKPLLVLCNKADMRGTSTQVMNVVEVMEKLDLVRMLNESNYALEGYVQPKTRMWMCSALKNKTSGKQDTRLKVALKWLLGSITEQWSTLSPRVEAEHGIELAKIEQNRKELMERRRRQIEEEERLENEKLLAENGNGTVTMKETSTEAPVAVSADVGNNFITVVAEIEKGNKEFQPKSDTKDTKMENGSAGVVANAAENVAEKVIDNVMADIVSKEITDKPKTKDIESSEVEDAANNKDPNSKAQRINSSERLVTINSARPPRDLPPLPAMPKMSLESGSNLSFSSQLPPLESIKEESTQSNGVTKATPTMPQIKNDSGKDLTTKRLLPPINAQVPPNEGNNNVKIVITSPNDSELNKDGELSKSDASISELSTDKQSVTSDVVQVNTVIKQPPKRKAIKIVKKIKNRNKTYPINNDITSSSPQQPVPLSSSWAISDDLPPKAVSELSESKAPPIISTNHPNSAGKPFVTEKDTIVQSPVSTVE